MSKEKIASGHFSADVAEFIFLLNKYEVKYLLVGGEAVIFYGHARLTGDVDFFYENTASNAEALYNALMEFWNSNIPEIQNATELQEPGLILQFGLPPNRIDLLNSISGVQFDRAWTNRVNVGTVWQDNQININFIGKADLIANKRSANRSKDQDDIKYLTVDETDRSAN